MDEDRGRKGKARRHAARGAHHRGAEVAQLRGERRAQRGQQLVEQAGGVGLCHQAGQRADGGNALLPVELAEGKGGVGVGEGGGRAGTWEMTGCNISKETPHCNAKQIYVADRKYGN